jgi:hypothetical protein
VPPGIGVVVLPGGRTQIRGAWADCVQAGGGAPSSGRLVGAPEIAPDGTGRFLVTVRLLPLAGPRVVVERLPWYRAEPGLAATAGVIGTGLLVLAGWAIATVIPVLPEVGRWLLTVAVVLLGVWLLAGQAGVCPGIHCPGCKCGRA